MHLRVRLLMLMLGVASASGGHAWAQSSVIFTHTMSPNGAAQAGYRDLVATLARSGITKKAFRKLTRTLDGNEVHQEGLQAAGLTLGPGVDGITLPYFSRREALALHNGFLIVSTDSSTHIILGEEHIDDAEEFLPRWSAALPRDAPDTALLFHELFHALNFRMQCLRQKHPCEEADLSCPEEALATQIGTDVRLRLEAYRYQLACDLDNASALFNLLRNDIASRLRENPRWRKCYRLLALRRPLPAADCPSATTTTTTTTTTLPEPFCGDSSCDSGEGCSTCPADCGDCPTTTTTTTTTTTLASGCFEDWGDGTIRDVCTGLQWEKKTTAVGSGMNAADPHDVDNLYSWAGVCEINTALRCQPSAEAAATCLAHTGDAVGCDECPAVDEWCDVDPSSLGALTTVWEWLNQVNAAALGGHADWRLPTVAGDTTFPTGQTPELESILDPPCLGGGPCIDPIFGPTVGSGAAAYWSSSTFITNPLNAWRVNFVSGGPFSTVKTFPVSVRAVRDAP